MKLRYKRDKGCENLECRTVMENKREKMETNGQMDETKREEKAKFQTTSISPKDRVFEIIKCSEHILEMKDGIDLPIFLANLLCPCPRYFEQYKCWFLRLGQKTTHRFNHRGTCS